MRIRNTLAALTAVAMLACASAAAVADDNTIVLYQGAQFNGRTNVSVNTATANVGDRIRFVTIAAPDGSASALPAADSGLNSMSRQPAAFSS